MEPRHFVYPNVPGLTKIVDIFRNSLSVVSEIKKKHQPVGWCFFLSCPNIHVGQNRSPAQRGGAFAPYKRFAAGKTLA
jgi:hypothetical protein